MTHLEMFREICNAEPCARLHHNSDGSFCIFKINGNTLTAPEPSPEEAIGAAFKKLFPSIPQSFGLWYWNTSGFWRAEKSGACVSKAQYGYVLKSFKGEAANWFFPIELPDLLKLFEINPELKPPTEDKEAA